MLNFKYLTYASLLFTNQLIGQNCGYFSNIVLNNKSMEKLIFKYADSFVVKSNFYLQNKDSLKKYIHVQIEDSVYENNNKRTLLLMAEYDYDRLKYSINNNFEGFIYYKNVYLIFRMKSKDYIRQGSIKNPYMFYKTKCDTSKSTKFYNELAPYIYLEFINGKLIKKGITSSNFISISEETRIDKF